MTQPLLTAAQETFIKNFDDGRHDQSMRDVVVAAFAHRNALARGGLQSPTDTLAALVAKLDEVTT